MGSLRIAALCPEIEPAGALRRTLVVGALVALLAGGFWQDGVAARAADPPPFGVDLGTGVRSYVWARGVSSVSDDLLDASIARVGLDEWELTLRAKQADLPFVWFPWQPQRDSLGGSLADDIVYSAEGAGVAQLASGLREWGWRGGEYPGPSFAPLVIVADGTRARLVAATNWPPQCVRPMRARHRTGLLYDRPQPAGTTRKYRALVAEFQGDASRGIHPWHLAVDRYRTWLHARMREAGLYPLRYSAPLRELNGWLNWQLNGYPKFDPAALQDYHQRWKTHFPWMQFWGQMSNYAGAVHLARPPLERGEQTGCCVAKREMHRRYLPELPRIVQRMRSAGTRVGFYCRPRDPYDKQRLDDAQIVGGETNLQFLLEWIRRNRDDYGADAVYIDTLGNYNFGQPLLVAELFRNRLPGDVVIEGVVDIYPCANLLSGFIRGGSWNGGPGHTIRDLGPEYTGTTFPAFSRYLLNDRIVFVGESNRDWELWGAEHDYWVERQAFLLGAKLDVMHPYESHLRKLGSMNRALELILAQWERVGWWARRPVYHDRAGIHGVPAGIDVRRFRGSAGEDLFVIDNWRRRIGLTFRYLDKAVRVPDQPLAIVVLDPPEGPGR